MERLGPDVPASLLVYFKHDTTEEEIAQFDRDYVMVPRADGRGESHRHGIRTDFRLVPAQANGYDALALTFHDDTAEEERVKAKTSFESRNRLQGVRKYRPERHQRG